MMRPMVRICAVSVCVATTVVLATPPARGQVAVTSDSKWVVGRALVGTGPTPELGPPRELPNSDWWTKQRNRPRELLLHLTAKDRARFGDAIGAGIRGDLTLSAAGVVNVRSGKTWTVTRLRSRLEIASIAGTRVGWAHDVDVVGQTIGAAQGGARSRRPIAVRQARLAYRAGWGTVSAGRLVVASGAGGWLVDGARATAPVTTGGYLTVFAGLAPDPVSLAARAGGGRFGLSWANSRRNGKSELQWSLGYRGQTWDGYLEPNRVDATLRLDTRGVGELDAAVTLAFGRADLTNVHITQGGVVMDGAGAPIVSPERLWLAWSSARSKAGWAWRGRYSFHRPVLDRMWAANLPWDAWIDGQQHRLVLELDGAASRGWWFGPRLHGAWLTGAGTYGGPQAGLGLRGGFRGRTLSPTVGLNADIGLRSHWDGTAAGPSRGLGLRVGSRLALTRRWSLSGRISGRFDEILPIGDALTRVRAEAGAEFAKGPWFVGLRLGSEAVVAGQPADTFTQLDWVDVSVLVRRNLR